MKSNWQYPEQGLIPVPYHHTMLTDQNRCSAFQRAIRREVHSGDVVFEAGAGTGLLSYFAAQTARKVYAVEADPNVARLGLELVRLNHLEERVDYRVGLAQEQLPDEPVDVVICEMLHVALAVEQQIPVLNAVRRGLSERFPGHNYRVIPESAVCYCQLIEANFDFYGFQAPFVRFGIPYIADPTLRPLSPIASYLDVDFGALAETNINASCRLVANETGEANAIRILTQAVLSLSPSLPPDQRLIDWYLHFLVIPLPRPFPVVPGSALTAELSYPAGCPLDQIQLEVHPAD